MDKMRLSLLISYILLTLLPISSRADTIVLKNGKRIENVQVWEDKDHIKCHRFGAVIGYAREIVERIEKGPVMAKPSVPEIRSSGRENEAPLNAEISPYKEISPGETGPGFMVTRVIDGDSFEAAGYGIHIRARLVGIDTPEKANKRRNVPAQPYSEEAEEYVREMILNKTVRLKGYGIGYYNRPLVEIFSGQRNINLELIALGLAEVYQGKHPGMFDPRPYYEAENKAKSLYKGMWILGNSYVSPKVWRKMHRR